MDIRKSFRFYKFLNALCLNIVSMTCLKCHFLLHPRYYTLQRSSHQFNMVVVWCHNGTSDCKDISLQLSCRCPLHLHRSDGQQILHRHSFHRPQHFHRVLRWLFTTFIGAPLLGHPVKRIRSLFSLVFSFSSYSFMSFSVRASISAGIASLSNLNWLP